MSKNGEPIYARVPKEHKEWIDDRAAREYTSASEIMRRAIRSYIKEIDPTAFQQMMNSIGTKDSGDGSGESTPEKV